jgi:hypothetical protein
MISKRTVHNIYRLELNHATLAACNRGKEYRIIKSNHLKTQVELGGKAHCIMLYKNNFLRWRSLAITIPLTPQTPPTHECGVRVRRECLGVYGDDKGLARGILIRRSWH